MTSWHLQTRQTVLELPCTHERGRLYATNNCKVVSALLCHSIADLGTICILDERVALAGTAGGVFPPPDVNTPHSSLRGWLIGLACMQIFGTSKKVLLFINGEVLITRASQGECAKQGWAQPLTPASALIRPVGGAQLGAANRITLSRL